MTKRVRLAIKTIHKLRKEGCDVPTIIRITGYSQTSVYRFLATKLND